MMKSLTALALLLVAVGAIPARAQQADPRWTPWLGCWQMLDDRVRDNNLAGADAVADARRRTLGKREDVTVCVTPASQSDGVLLSTRASGQPAFDQTIVADAVAHPVTEAGCTGTQRAEWSGDGRRLFAHAELTCANQPRRTISGLTLIAADGAWVDVQALDVAGRTNVRVRRYRRQAADRATRSSFAPAGGSLTIDAVKEASTKVAPAALEAALIETGARFNLNGATLVGLDEANVPAAVIDLMVALSYPEKFRVERRPDTSLDLSSLTSADAGWGGAMGLGYPYLGLGYPYFDWSPDYYGHSYYYSPFGYGYSGIYGPAYYYPGSGLAGGGTNPEPSAGADGGGRVVNGVGYTRIRPREAVGVESSGGDSTRSSRGGRSTVSSSGYSQSGGSSDGSSSGGSGSSGGGGSSSSGSGGSGGSGGGGRTAQPR
jgi:hypothetical protein